MKTAPNCFKCRYFNITHQPRTPRGCSWFGIRSQELPSLAVFFATGQHCPKFTPKDEEAGVAPAQSGPGLGWIA